MLECRKNEENIPQRVPRPSRRNSGKRKYSRLCINKTRSWTIMYNTSNITCIHQDRFNWMETPYVSYFFEESGIIVLASLT